jgi:hypothetical protein
MPEFVDQSLHTHHQPDQPIQIKAAGDMKTTRFGALRLAARRPRLEPSENISSNGRDHPAGGGAIATGYVALRRAFDRHAD